MKATPFLYVPAYLIETRYNNGKHDDPHYQYCCDYILLVSDFAAFVLSLYVLCHVIAANPITLSSSILCPGTPVEERILVVTLVMTLVVF